MLGHVRTLGGTGRRRRRPHTGTDVTARERSGGPAPDWDSITRPIDPTGRRIGQSTSGYDLTGRRDYRSPGAGEWTEDTTFRLKWPIRLKKVGTLWPNHSPWVVSDR